jgi:hypothetical protein
MMHLILAAIWFATAAFIFLHNPGAGGKGIIPIPLSGVALVFGLYNLVRWWTFRASRTKAQLDVFAPPRRRVRRASDDLAEPDPNFVFTDPPPANPSGPPANEGRPGGP